MFPRRYFSAWMFASRYFPDVTTNDVFDMRPVIVFTIDRVAIIYGF